MNTLERDQKAIMDGDTIEVMKRRKAKIAELEARLGREKNSFCASILAHQLEERRAEYQLLGNMI
ncbi:hypothetical protein QS713_08885 [Gleimia hominis]|uniref:Uncharacterized protein n=1 Tax=Gleimia hominis TaxID=595468 RepID=A0ABU3ICT4_9ACTO|nr:hypothetical protein [Gleimia hominis]MDT3768173.1 hypothetical protein [Gleimia hominis]